MAQFKKTSLLCAIIAGFCMIAGSAFAGPVWTFGPDDQGLMKLDYKGQFQYTMRDTGSGADGTDDTNEFNFRRNRLALMGAYGQNFSLYVQTEFSEDNNIRTLNVTNGNNSDFQILDAVLRFKQSSAFNVWLGKFKYNLTRENLESCEDPLTLDRSLLIRAPLASEGTRDKGIAVWGNLFEDMFQYRLDVMNGRNDSVSSPKSNPRISARAHISLLDPESGYGYKGTYRGDKQVLTLGAAYQMEDDVAYADLAQTRAIDYSAWTVDLFFEYPVEAVGTFTLSAAYVDYDLDDAYQNGSPDANVIGLVGEKNGGYVKGAYMFPNLPLQLFARGENWTFASLDGIIDQELDWYGAGFNYYFRGQNLKLTMEVSQVDYDKELGAVEDFTTVTTQLQVVF